MRQLASIVVAALLAGCSESAAPAAIDATVADASGMDVAVEEAAVLVGEEPPQVFGPWPGMLPDVISTGEVYSGVSPDVITTPRCVPGTTARCVCDDLREGLQGCYPEGAYRACVCPPPVPPPAQPLPPRLVRPLSGLRVTSQRPTLRWVLPDGVTRARVEVCADRPCARVIERAEVSGSSWRPTMRLPPGVAFWRVQGLNASGGVTWTSATWEFGVRHSDAPVDTAYGSLKDYNGDGYDDLVAVLGTIPRPRSGEMGRGRPFVFNGSRSGIATDPSVRLNEEFCNLPSFERLETFYVNLESADVNGDGFADLIAGNVLGEDPCGLGETVVVYQGGRDGLAGVSRRIDRSVGLTRWNHFAATFAAGDINGDGFGDVLVIVETTNFHEYRALVYSGSSSGVSPSPNLSSPWRWSNPVAGVDFTSATVGDVDGDGYADLIVRVAGDIAILYGDAEGTLQRVSMLTPDLVTFTSNCQAVDVNGDGKADIVGGSPTTLWEGVGGSLVMSYQRFNPRALYRGELAQYGVVGTPGDGVGDGVPDILSRDFCIEESMSTCTTGAVSLYERTRDEQGMGVLRNLRSATPSTRASFVGDVNGDGADELVIAEGQVIEVYTLSRGMSLQTRIASTESAIRLE